MRTRLWLQIRTLERWILLPRQGLGITILRLVCIACAIPFAAFYLAGVGVDVERVLTPSQFQPLLTEKGEAGHGVELALPSSLGDTPGQRPSRLRFFEDGVELGLPHASPEAINREGGGRFSLLAESLSFSASDNTDPRTNGRTYSVRYTTLAGNALVAWAILALAYLLCARPLRDLLLRLERMHPGWLLLGFALLTIGLRLYWGYDTGIVDYARVRQMPFSDAQGWMELSEDFARGARINMSWEVWDARRPMTYVLNGSWMAVFGISTLSIVVFNVLCSAISAALIFDALRRLTIFPIALAGALLHVTSAADAAYATTTLSEPSGYFLSNVAIWFLARAVVGERRGEAPRGLYFLAGATIAIANLSRPLTLLSAPAIPLLVLLLLSRRGLSKRRVCAGAIRAGFFVALGLVVFIGPWVIRQQLKHGISTLSDNTAEMLFAASDPEHSTWSPEVSLEATKAGHWSWADRNAYFNARLKQNLKDHPDHYAEVIVRSAASALIGRMALAHWWAFALLLLALWSSGGRRATGEFFVFSGVALAVTLAMAYGIKTPRVWVFFFLGSALALLQADLLALLVVSLGFTLFSIGLVAAPYPRFTYSLHWLALAVEVWAVWQLSRVARRGGPPPDLEALRAEGLQPALSGERSATRLLTRVLLLLTCVLGLGLAIALARTWRPQISPPLEPLAQGDAWLSSALACPAAADYAAVSSKLVVRRFNIRSNYLAKFKAGEHVTHASGLFRFQNYDRSYFQTAPPTHVPAGLPLLTSHATFPALLEIEGEVAVTAVGFWVASGPEIWGGKRSALFEVLAFTRGQAPGEEPWVWGAAEDRRAQAPVLEKAAAAGALYTDPSR